MAAQNATGSDHLVLSASKTRRDYRLSLALLVAGLVITVTSYSLMFSGMTTSSFATATAISIVANIGGILVLVGAIFAAINWALLRTGWRSP